MKAIFMILTFGVIVTLFGCQSRAVHIQDEPVADTNEPFRTVDRARPEINIQDEVHSIISMAPAITVMLVDLGLEDAIIAMDEHSASMLGEVSVPTFDMLNPEVESIIALDPDLVLASTMSMMGDVANDPFLPLADFDITVAYIPTSTSIEDIQADLHFISTITGQAARGEALIATMIEEIEEIVALVDPNKAGLTVYFEISPAPYLFSFGQGVFLHEMIALIGGENIFGDLYDWLSVEAESVVSANPDVIFTNASFLDDPVAEILSRPGFEGVNAVANERVYFIENDVTSLPTHQITRGMRMMLEALYGSQNNVD